MIEYAEKYRQNYYCDNTAPNRAYVIFGDCSDILNCIDKRLIILVAAVVLYSALSAEYRLDVILDYVAYAQSL